MSACEDRTSQLHLFLDGELTPGEEARLKFHLEICPECAAEVKRLAELNAAMEKKLDAKFTLPDDARIVQQATQGKIKSRVRRTVFRILRKAAIASAAAAVVVVVAAFLIHRLYFKKTFSYELEQTVLRCSDGIEISDDGADWQPLRAGAHLPKETEIQTSPAAQSFMSFHGIRLLADRQTTLKMNGARSFAIEDGDVFLASAERERPVIVALDDTSVRSNGSVLRIDRKQESASVVVVTGTAEITLTDGTTHQIGAGTRATLRKGTDTLDLVSTETTDPFARRKISAIDRARQRFDKIISKHFPNYRMSRRSGQGVRLADLIDPGSRPNEMYKFASCAQGIVPGLARAASTDVDEYYERLFAPSNRAIAVGRQSTVKMRPGRGPGTSAWSHDGSMLAFIEATENSPYTTVRVVRLDDLENPWDISQECVSAIAFQSLAWSPDDRHVLFTMDDNVEVYENGGWEWTGPPKIKIAPIDPDAGPLRDFITPFRDIFVSAWPMMGTTVSPYILKLPWGDALLCTNWGNVAYIPIEPDGQSVPHAPGLHLTDFNPREVVVLGARWSPSAGMIMFTAVEDLHFGQLKTYILHDVEDILDGFTDPPRSLEDPRIKWVAPTTNYQVEGGFSYDESLAFFQEDVNQRWDPRHPTRLQGCDFDLFYASVLSKGESGAAQIHVPGSQVFIRPSPEGNRLAYSNYTVEKNRLGRSELKGELRVVSFDIEADMDMDLGGVLIDNSGTNLIVPPGTLEENFGVTISTPFAIGEEAEPTEGDNTFFAMRLLNAKGLDNPQFNEPMTLTIRYTDDEVAGLDEDMLQIYYYDESDPENPKWVPMGGTVDPEYNEITVEIRHFSKFAVGGKKESSRALR